MRLLFFIIVALAAYSTEGLPRFEISGYSSRSDIPQMMVTFENGVSDSLVLEPYSDSPCNFIGQLENYPSTAAVTGCLAQPGDKMSITLLSDLNTKSNMYELDFDGTVEIVENPFKYQEEPSGVHHPDSRAADGGFHKHDDKMNDEEKDSLMESLAGAVTAEAVRWPRKLYTKVKFGYDKTMKKQMAAQGTTIGKWIDSVMAHVQSYYKHPTLPTKIMFKYDKKKTIFKNANWPNTDYLNQASQAGVEDNDPDVDLYAWFGKDKDYWGTVGLAWVGGCCKTHDKTSFNEWRKTAAATAMVLAHEMGHNFGMSHDFDKKHGGDNSACNGLGIMSYGDAPAKWSQCSISDFTGYYNLRKWGERCLSSWSWKKPCEDDCPGPLCGISAPGLCTDKGCGGRNCYGGCNGNSKSYFDKYCKKTCGKC